jgi:DNA-binding GntR family transcriptional regulator
MTPDDLARAQAACDAFAVATDPMSWGDLNRDFHAALYRASELAYHLEVTGNAMDRVDRYLRMQLLLSDGNARATAEHLAILRACRAGDADAAADLTRAHIRGVRDSLLSHLPIG